MDERSFWAIIARTRREPGLSLVDQTALLRDELSALDTGELVDFDAMMTAANHQLYSWELWGAADLILHGCSEDVFTDFRSWVVTHGQQTADRVRADPDSLAALNLDDLADLAVLDVAKEFASTAADLYAARVSRPIDDDFADHTPLATPATGPAGDRFEGIDEALAARYPRLVARHPAASAARVPPPTARWWRRFFRD